MPKAEQTPGDKDQASCQSLQSLAEKKQVHRREYAQFQRSMELKNATKQFLTGTIICEAPKKHMRISKISQLLRKQSF